MRIEFDPRKDVLNARKHGLSLALAQELEWDLALVEVDRRFPYDEWRMRALVPLGERLFAVAFVDADETRRIVSLRHADKREVNLYVENFP